MEAADGELDGADRRAAVAAGEADDLRWQLREASNKLDAAEQAAGDAAGLRQQLEAAASEMAAAHGEAKQASELRQQLREASDDLTAAGHVARTAAEVAAAEAAESRRQLSDAGGKHGGA